MLDICLWFVRISQSSTGGRLHSDVYNLNSQICSLIPIVSQWQFQHNLAKKIYIEATEI